MAGNINQLRQRLAAIDLELSNLTGGTAPALPNAQGGGSLDFVGYRKSLLEERKALLEAISIADGPWELETREP